MTEEEDLVRHRKAVRTANADASGRGRLPFHFFSREGNEPPHVHVRKGDAIAKLWLQPIRLAFSEGFNPSEIRRLRQLNL